MSCFQSFSGLAGEKDARPRARSYGLSTIVRRSGWYSPVAQRCAKAMSRASVCAMSAGLRQGMVNRADQFARRQLPLRKFARLKSGEDEPGANSGSNESGERELLSLVVEIHPPACAAQLQGCHDLRLSGWSTRRQCDDESLSRFLPERKKPAATRCCGSL